jgi:SSS family solute:Na+ symporter
MRRLFNFRDSGRLIIGTISILTAACVSAAEAATDAPKVANSMLQGIDWVVLGIFFMLVIGIGLMASRSAGKNTSEFFLGGRGMPWWLLGVSMVACTFSCDTPNLVTGMCRMGGVVSNWGWWAFLITGMVTVFIYAGLWRRSKVMTDLEFYELRYSGKPAAFLRCFRSLYLGVFFNCLIMGTVTLAAIKIGAVIFGLDPLPSVIFASVGVVLYATLGGIKGCIWADFFQYSIAMFGAIYAAYIACQQPEVGGLTNLLKHPDVVGKLSWMPDFSNWLAWVPLLLIPVVVQWWAVWYPGAEPGGGGYIAQRMLAAKNEKNAIGATLFFNFMHYAIRPWPWIIVGLASIICYPQLADIKAQFPGISPAYLAHDIAYPVMISKLGPGFLGLVVASLVAAYMSTIGTHLNWGSSYAVNDFYKRFLKPNASEKELVMVGRLCTVLLMIIASTMALTFLESANQAFEILLLSGAGTGAIYILRWFWWRINAWTEIIAMIAATIVAFWIVLGLKTDGTIKFYVDSSAVSDRVLAIESPEMARTLSFQRAEMQPAIDKQKALLSKKVDAWKKANKESQAARDQARAAYDTLNVQIGQMEKNNSVLSLITDSAALINIANFKARLESDLLERENAKLAKANSKLAPDAKVALKTKAFSSIAAIIKGKTIYVYDTEIISLKFPVQLLICVFFVTIAWLGATFLSPGTNKATLRNFYRTCHPGGPGWRRVVEEAKADGENIDEKNLVSDWKMPIQILCIMLGCFAIYSSLFCIGNIIYGKTVGAIIMAVVAIASTVGLFFCFDKIGTED